MTTLNIPWPPSANRIWRNVNGKTLKSAEYRQWLSIAALSTRMQRPKPVAGRYRLTVIATRPDNRRRDLDNLLKPVCDLLTTMGLIEDDHLAQEIRIGWSDEGPVEGGCIVAQIEAVSDIARAA
jgi:crossover junction endodeoxyribonuclease RusA